MPDQTRIKDFEHAGVRYVVEKFDRPGDVLPVEYILRGMNGSGEFGLIRVEGHDRYFFAANLRNLRGRTPFSGRHFVVRGDSLDLI